MCLAQICRVSNVQKYLALLISGYHRAALRHESIRAIADHERVRHQLRPRQRGEPRGSSRRGPHEARHAPPVRVQASPEIRELRRRVPMK